MFGSFADRLSVLLTDFLSDKPNSGEHFCSFMRNRVVSYCASHAPKLPRDLREDVLQECILILYTRGTEGFDAEAGSAAGYVYHTVRRVLQSVIRRHGLTHEVLQSESQGGVDLVAIASESLTCAPLTCPDHYEHRQLASWALKIAGPEFGRVLWRVYVNHECRQQVLADAKMSRFAFDRRRRAIAKSLAALPKCA